MTDEVLDTEESLNLEENLDSIQEPVIEDVNDSEAELNKAKEIAENQRIRAEKAERELKALKKQPVETSTPKNETSNEDELYALIEAKVPKEDFKSVREAAKLLGVSVIDALNNPIVKNILSQKAEERASAQAANTASNKRSTINNSDEKIVEDFKQGKVSDKDEDIRRLVEAQQALRRKEAKGD